MDTPEGYKDFGASRLSSFFESYWVPFFWAVLCVAFYWDVLTAPPSQIVAGNDLNNMFRIWLDYARARLSTGHLPLWNPYLNAGYAFIGDPQPALFYPPTWLSLLFSPTQGLNWSTVAHIWWAAVGSTFWLHSITDQEERQLPWTACLSGAAVYAFSGFIFARIQAGHIGMISSMAWLPWTLWAVYKLSKNFSWRVAGWGAVCIGLALLAGHTATFLYLAIMLGSYALFLTWHLPPDKRKHYLTMVLVMGGLGVTLASVQLLPTLDLISASSRLGSADYSFASRFSWPVGYIITLLVPNFFGEPVRTGYWGDGIYDEMIFYVGILPLLLIWVAGRIHRDKQISRHTFFWLGVAGVSLLTSFGSNGILHTLLYRFVPLFSSMRAPARAGMLFTCSAAVLTACAVQTLSREDEDERKSLLSPFTPSMITGLLITTGGVVLCAFGVFAWGRESNPAAGRFWHMANAIATFGLFFSLAAVWLRFWAGPTPSRYLSTAALVIILLDLWTLGNGLVRIVPAPLSSYWERVALHVKTSAGRVLPWGLSIFEQNGALSYKVQSVFGYNPLEDQNYNEFTTSKPDPRARIYDLLNVTHVATTVPIDLEEEDSLSLLIEDSGVYLYNRSTALPRVWTSSEIESVDETQMISRINDPTFDPLHTTLVKPGISCPYNHIDKITIIDSTEPERINAKVEGDGGIVVFSERYTSGWNARIDGDRVPIIQADGILRAVCVPPGEHIIQLRYQPPLLVWGTALSALSLATLCALFWLSRSRKSE